MTPTNDLEVDLLVVGAGPAGSAAALVASKSGLNTLIVERRPFVGRPVRCGEYVPDGLRREVPDHVFSAVQSVTSLTLHLPSGTKHHLASPGAVIDRGRFDRDMVDAAVDAGATLWLETPLVELKGGGIATLGGRYLGTTVRATLIIGADGPRSRVAKASGLGRPRVMVGLQREVGLSQHVQNAHLYFWSTCRYGYGWLFPKGKRANLGVAVPRGAARLGRVALAELTGRIAAQGMIHMNREGKDGRGEPGRGGLVPCSGPLPRIAAGRVLLAGDAAGQTDALTGAGIVAAIRGGTLAGKAVASAIASGKWSQAGPVYESRWRRSFGRSASRSLERRYELEARWERDVERAVRATWLSQGE